MAQTATRSHNYGIGDFSRYAGASVTTAVGDTVIALVYMDAANAGVTGITCKIGGSAGGSGGTAMTPIDSELFFDPPTNSLRFMRAFKIENYGTAGTTLVEGDVVYADRKPRIIALSAFDSAGVCSAVSPSMDSTTGNSMSRTVTTAADDLLLFVGQIEATSAPVEVAGTTEVRSTAIGIGETWVTILSKPHEASGTTLGSSAPGPSTNAHHGLKVVVRPAGGGGDTTPPTLTGTITPGTLTSSSISYSWSAGADNVAVTSYERSLDGGSTWLDVGAGLSRTDSGLAASTAYAARVRAKDAAGNVSTPAIQPSGGTISTSAGSDTTPPTLTGTITPGTLTSSSISYSWPSGADNVAVTSYERSLDGGSTWLDVGAGLSRTDSGLAASTAYAVRVRAKDAAGNVSTPAIQPSGGTISTSAAATFSATMGPFAVNTGAGQREAGTAFDWWAALSVVIGGDWDAATRRRGSGTLNAQGLAVLPLPTAGSWEGQVRFPADAEAEKGTARETLTAA